jgi:hypothetical protein
MKFKLVSHQEYEVEAADAEQALSALEDELASENSSIVMKFWDSLKVEKVEENITLVPAERTTRDSLFARHPKWEPLVISYIMDLPEGARTDAERFQETNCMVCGKECGEHLSICSDYPDRRILQGKYRRVTILINGSRTEGNAWIRAKGNEITKVEIICEQEGDLYG